MSATSSIEWTEKTWNPVRGCSVVSPGCVNCYAMKQAHRFSGTGKPFEGLTKQTKAGPQWTGVVRTVESALLEPLSWRKPQRVFVNSMSDLFHEDVTDAFIDKVFAVMSLAPQHTFQILTKRADRMRAYLSRHDVGLQWLVNGYRQSDRAADVWAYQEADAVRWTREGLPNVWLGVSVEDQKHADLRIPQLLQTPAAVRFISAEPLLGPVKLDHMDVEQYAGDAGYYFINALTGRNDDMGRPCRDVPHLDWVIVGGESGSGARPFDLAWARSIVQQCQAAGVACFVKQLGAKPREVLHSPRPPLTGVYEPVYRDRKGGDPSEWPADLRVREFPMEAAQ